MEEKVIIEMTARPATAEEISYANKLLEMEKNLDNGMSFEDALEVFNNG